MIKLTFKNKKMKTLLNRKAKITSDNDNYDKFRNETLIIIHVAYNTDQHPGYDEGLKGQALCDFKTLSGENVPYSLYEYEFELI